MLALDVILLILTMTSIGYCFILNRRILQIQKYREELFKMLRDFETSINNAENILKEIRLINPKAEQTLQDLETKTNNVTTNLKTLVVKADGLAEELETMIISGNKLATKLNYFEEYAVEKDSKLSLEELSSQEPIDSSEPSKKTTSLEAEIFSELGIALSEQQKLSQEEYYKILQKIAKK